MTAKRELRAAARQQAVAAARVKAEVYADAAGVRLGAVLHVEDVDADSPHAQRFRTHASAAAEALAANLAPGHVIVTAAAIVGYAIARD
ncbi:SIMPL domain-containing protein [Dactylosporangium sp. CS-047395]|uniref:SIMPL domain-containing protein n=1 Tax=Dactylosporangium sp. CS-047395 TaxID=3239936 RepID=UPI003D8B1EB9